MATQALYGRGRPTAFGTSLSTPRGVNHSLRIPLCASQCDGNIARNSRILHNVAAAPRTLEANPTASKPASIDSINSDKRNTNRHEKLDTSLLSSTSTPPASTTPTTARLPTRDPRRLVAFTGALAAVGGLSYTWFSGQAELPPLEAVTGPLSTAFGLLLFGVPAGLLLTKAVLRDQFHVELHRGRLYVCAGVPSRGPPLPPGSVEVRPTGDVRGNGAYAAAPIPAGTHIANYSGDLLDRAAFLERYPDSVGDYAMAIDDEYVIDAASIAPHTATFHAVHMNHSRSRANVRRYYSRRERRVSFFATRDIEIGEELLYDYGRAYWYGREHLELP